MEAGGALDVGDEVTVRLVAESSLPADGPDLEALVSAHAAVRAARGDHVLAPAEFGIVTHDGERSFWSVSPWVDASPLADVLDRVGSLPDPLTESIGQQAAEAVRRLHAAGIQGLCLSPTRVLLRGDSSVLLAELGLVSLLTALLPTEGEPGHAQHCMAPELLQGAAPSESSDLYALGALLYRLVAGEWPRPVETIEQLRADELDGARPNDRKPHSSIFLSEVVHTLLRADPEDRFPSAELLCQIFAERRKSEWWDGLGIGQHTTLAPMRGGRERTPDPLPLPIPAPATPPDREWITARTRVPRSFADHLTACVGRDAELSALLATVAELPAEGGEVILVEADAGQGKTRFVDALLERLRKLPDEDRPIVLAGSFRNLGIGRPLQAFSQLVTGMFDGSREVSAEQLEPLLGDATGIASPFADLLSGRTFDDETSRLTRHSVATAFAHILRTLAAEQPVVVLLENLQFADPEAIELFGFLSRLAGNLPLLVVATCRPPEEAAPLRAATAALEPLPQFSRARLLPLSDDEIREVVESVVAEDPRRDDLARAFARDCDGRPARVVQSLLLLCDSGVLRAAGAGFEIDGDASADAWQSLPREVHRERLARLGDRERAFLELASVQGVFFDAEVCRLALDWSRERLDESLAELETRRIINGRHPVFRFTDHTLFVCALDRADDTRLETLHERVADAFLASRNPDSMPPGETHGVLSYRVAWHYLLAGRALRGLLYVQRALAHLRDTWRLGVAERLAALACRALAELPDRGADLTDMELERAELLGALGRGEEEREVLDRALLWSRERGDQLRQARARLLLATTYERIQRPRDAREEARIALKCAQQVGDKRLQSRAHVLLGRIAFVESRYQQARTQLRLALELARELLDDIAAAEALQALGHISQGVGSFEHAEELQRQAMRIYRNSGDLAHEGESLASLGQISAALGDRVKAEGLLRRSLAIQRSVGDGYGEARVLGALGVVVQDSGRPIEALEIHRQCLAVTRDMGARDLEIVALLNLATSSYLVGRLDEARDEYGDALRAAREIRDRRLQGYALSGLGDVARQKGEDEIAENLARRALRKLRKVEDEAGLSAALLGLGRTALQRGRDQAAHTAFEEAVSVASAVSARGVTALAQAYLALLGARRGEEEDAQARIAQAGALVQSLKGSEATRVELLFVHSLLLRVLGRAVEADRKMLQAEQSLSEMADALPEDERNSLLTELSPHREIVAGAAAARAGLRELGRGLEDTAPVE